jgi:NitT/TauT family transport system substrate-binding protein
MPITLIENFRAVFYTPFYAAFALKAYDEAGIEVRRLDSDDPAQTMPRLLSGQGDVAWGGPIRLLVDHQKPDSPLVAFCEVVRRDPFFLVGRTPRPTFQLTDLLGLKVATVSEVPTPWLCLRHDLRLAGLDPAQLTRLPDRSMPDNLAALHAGEIDVMQAFQPFVEQALDAGGHLWYAAASRGRTAYTSFYTTRACLEREPDSLLRMTRAMYRTQQWIATHEVAELAALVAEYFPSLAISTLTRALARYKTLQLWNHTPMMQSDGLLWLRDACLSGGYIQRSVAYEQCVEMRFAAQVVAETPPTVADEVA